MPDMSDDQVDLAALLCSRLCHDLLSPVGAMNNGLELLADETDPAMRARCIDLLNESAAAAANKLKFFRLAFGAAGGFGPTVDPTDARAVAQGLVEDARTKLVWDVPEGPLPKAAVKILLNMVLIAREALVRGGTLAVGAESRDGETEIVVRAEGPKLVLDAQVRAALEGGLDPAQIDSRTAAAHMVQTLAQRGGGMVQIAGGSNEPLLMGALIKS
jgi:histidine phosphotransferase ChpT